MLPDPAVVANGLVAPPTIRYFPMHTWSPEHSPRPTQGSSREETE